MKKLFLYVTSFFLFFTVASAEEISPVKKDFEEIFNVGKMMSHDDKFTLYFRTRKSRKIWSK